MNVATVLYFSNFQLEEVNYIQFNEIVLHNNQIAFKNFFWIKKYKKTDGATSILMGDYCLQLTIFFIH